MADKQELADKGDRPDKGTGGPGEPSAARLDALVRLLADEDQKIRRVARENLQAAGKKGLEAVRDRAGKAGDPEVRAAANQYLREERREEALLRWTAFAQKDGPDLETGAFLIAQTEYPDLDPAASQSVLDGYGEVLKKRLSAIRSPETMVERINHLLFGELGYRGNKKDYYDPRNSYLNMVIERKLGIPISISALYLFVTRRLGQKLEGVGMPGHFILRYWSGRKAVFLDPFDQGRRWTHQDCVAHLESEGYGFREEYLRAVGDRDILERMLANLLGVYHGREDRQRTERVTRMLTAIRNRGLADLGSQK